MLTLIKTLTWLASPIGILTACSMAAGCLLLLQRCRRTRLLLVTIGISQLLFFASPWTAKTLNEELDAKARQLQRQNIGGSYAAIFLLGGMIDYDPATGTVNFGNSVDRLWFAAELFHQKLSSKIIVSGGNMVAARYPNAPTQAHLMKDALVTLGVPADAIILEPEALTTRQHMPLVKALMQAQNLQGRLAVVTSGIHTPRAMMNARSHHIAADAYPTDWTIPLRAQTPLSQFLPQSTALRDSESALKEWIALLAGY